MDPLGYGETENIFFTQNMQFQVFVCTIAASSAHADWLLQSPLPQRADGDCSRHMYATRYVVTGHSTTFLFSAQVGLKPPRYVYVYTWYSRT